MIVLLLALILLTLIAPLFVRFLFVIVGTVVALVFLAEGIHIIDRHFDKPALMSSEQVSPQTWQPVSPYRSSQP